MVDTNGQREPVRVAIVGLGYWGPNLARNVSDLSDSELSWICDTEEPKLRALARRYPKARRTRDFDDVLGDESLDAVVIATPVSTHYELSRAALEAGKHVFVEKPLAGSSLDALELMRLAAERNLTLMPGHTFLYSPPVNLIRDLIVSGGLGSVYFVSTSRVNLGLHQSDVSVVWDLAPHDFSILRYWFDAVPTRVAAFSRACILPGIADVAFIDLEFDSGMIGHVELSWLAPSKLRRTAVVGSERMVVYDDTSSEPVRIFDAGVIPPNPQSFGEYHLTYRTGEIISPPVSAIEPLAAELADFCSSIQSGRSLRSSAQIGLDVIRMVEAVDRSLEEQGAPVALEPSGAPVAQA